MKLPVEPPCESEPSHDVMFRCPVVIDHVTNTADRVVDYSDYMWMGEEMEEFDRQCLEEMIEDEFIESCIEEMLEEENEVYEYIDWVLEEFLDEDPEAILEHLHAFAATNNIELEFLQDPTKCRRRKHKLNPDAVEFVPRLSPVENVVLPPGGCDER